MSPTMCGSTLCEWDRLASVRTKPRRLLLKEEVADKVFFSPDLMPVTKHPIIADLGESAIRQLLVKRLYHYLDVTTSIEVNLVNNVLAHLFNGQTGIDLPEEMLFDAYEIYCDEAYHALFSIDLKRQVAVETGIAPTLHPSLRVLIRLKELRLSTPPHLAELAQFFFVVVYEMLISSILAAVPGDKRVVSVVRQVVADHAKDEGRHHAYFSKIFDFLWPRLEPGQRAIIGPLLPYAIRASLEPDYGAVLSMLAPYELSPADLRIVMNEAYPSQQVIADIRRAAKATLRLFERNDLFADPLTADAFQKCGLIE